MWFGGVGDVAAGEAFPELAEQGRAVGVSGVSSLADGEGVGEEAEVAADRAAGLVVDGRRVAL